MQIEQKRIVFVGEDVVIYNVVDLLPHHRNYPWGAHDVLKPNGQPAVNLLYRQVIGREIQKLYVHQTAGSVTYRGFEGLLNTAQFFVRDPEWRDGRWTGRGRGWPGFGYTWYLPYAPDLYKDKPIIFQANDLCDVTAHSGDNERSAALALQGYFFSRHIPNFMPRAGCIGGKPSAMQMRAFNGFVNECRGHLDWPVVLGHCDSPRPKLACPGDLLEELCKSLRTGNGDLLPADVPRFIPLPGMVKLESWRQRQAALVLLDCDIGTSGPNNNGVDGDPGSLTRLAVEALESEWGLPIDGYWDATFDYHLKVQLLVRGCSQESIEMQL